jgi:hypothetical protein
MNNTPNIPERVPNAVIMQFEAYLRANNQAEFTAIAKSLTDYLASDKVPAQLKAVAGKWNFRIVPKILVYLPEMKK